MLKLRKRKNNNKCVNNLLTPRQAAMFLRRRIDFLVQVDNRSMLQGFDRRRRELAALARVSQR